MAKTKVTTAKTIDGHHLCLVASAMAQVSDITSTARKLAAGTGHEDGAAIQALMLRVQDLLNAITYVVDDHWGKSTQDIGEIVEGAGYVAPTQEMAHG